EGRRFMIVAMAPGAREEEIQAVIAHLVELGFDVHRETGAERTVLACLGAGDAVRARLDPDTIAAMPGVADALRISAPYKLAARAFRREGTRVQLGECTLGDGELALLDPALLVPVEAESELLPEPAGRALWIPGGSMHNRALLRALGRVARPVVLERGPAASLEDWLLAAETILTAGNFELILSQPAAPRQPFDITALPQLHRLAHLPVVADFRSTPAHLVKSLACAAAAAAADGLILCPPDRLRLAAELMRIRRQLSADR
ncbi:MAG: hypothetical protein ACRD2D_13845, partial [Terriglobales bacterium]